MRFYIQVGRKGDLVTFLEGGKIAFLLPNPHVVALGQLWEGEVAHEAERFAKVRLTRLIAESAERAALQRRALESALSERFAGELAKQEEHLSLFRFGTTGTLEWVSAKTRSKIVVVTVEHHHNFEERVAPLRSYYTIVEEGVERHPGNTLWWALAKEKNKRLNPKVVEPRGGSALQVYDPSREWEGVLRWDSVATPLGRERLLVVEDRGANYDSFPRSRFPSYFTSDTWWELEVVTYRLERDVAAGTKEYPVGYVAGEYRVALLNTRTRARAPQGIEASSSDSGDYVSFTD